MDVVDVGPVRPRRKEGEKEVNEVESLGGEEEGEMFCEGGRRWRRGARWLLFGGRSRKGERGERE